MAFPGRKKNFAGVRGKIQMKRVAEAPVEGDCVEKKRPEEPVYPDPKRLFEDTLAELRVNEEKAIAKLKKARKLLLEFRDALRAQELEGVLHWDLVYLADAYRNAQPIDAPVDPRLIYTADEVGQAVADKVIALLKPFEIRDPNTSHLQQYLSSYIKQACRPMMRENGRIMPINLAETGAKVMGLTKIKEFLVKLKKASDKFHAEFKPTVV